VSLLAWRATRIVALGQIALLTVMAEQGMYVLNGLTLDASLAPTSGTLSDVS
jgi:hypothetical protein